MHTHDKNPILPDLGEKSARDVQAFCHSHTEPVHCFALCRHRALNRFRVCMRVCVSLNYVIKALPQIMCCKSGLRNFEHPYPGRAAPQFLVWYIWAENVHFKHFPGDLLYLLQSVTNKHFFVPKEPTLGCRSSRFHGEYQWQRLVLRALLWQGPA